MAFNGITNLRDAREAVKMEPWQLAEIRKCAQDPIYFIRTYVYINTKDYGMQLMDTYPFQNDAIKRFLRYRFNINRWSRQVGKSTIVRAFILWYGIFHKDKVIAMLANKLNLAKEQLQQLRDSYLALPYWMQPGVKLWNKTSIQFSNNTRILVAATSPDGIRGYSINLLYLDEFAFLREGLADEFTASVFPSISSGKTTRVIITSTPNGLNLFYRMWKDAVDEKNATYAELTTKYVRSTVLWNEVPGRTQEWGMEEMNRIGEQKFRQEYECEFNGSAVTLIDYKILQRLTPSKPLRLNGIPVDFSMRMFSKPVNKATLEAHNWTYVASLDTSFGMRKDYHVLQILLAKSNLDVEQVFVMSANAVTIEDFCLRSKQVLKMFGNPPLTIEYNGPGQRTYQLMKEAHEYDNIQDYDDHLRGLWVNNNIKQTAVLMLKLYVHRFFLKLHDEVTINELMSFTQLTSNKWGGGGGNHDDHITALYWAIYYINSIYFEGNIKELGFMDGFELAFLDDGTAAAMQNAIAISNDPDMQAEQHMLASMAADSAGNV